VAPLLVVILTHVLPSLIHFTVVPTTLKHHGLFTHTFVTPARVNDAPTAIIPHTASVGIPLTNGSLIAGNGINGLGNGEGTGTGAGAGAGTGAGAGAGTGAGAGAGTGAGEGAGTGAGEGDGTGAGEGDGVGAGAGVGAGVGVGLDPRGIQGVLLDFLQIVQYTHESCTVGLGHTGEGTGTGAGVGTGLGLGLGTGAGLGVEIGNHNERTSDGFQDAIEVCG
jgi:hypothetical protein